MPDTANKPYSDFAGFIDGFQARNLASIQRNVELHLSEMQTRLAIIIGQISKKPTYDNLKSDFLLIENAFRDNSESIVNRLVKIGRLLTELLIKNDANCFAVTTIYLQLKGFIFAYVEAAEISGNERMINTAIQLVDDFRKVLENRNHGEITDCSKSTDHCTSSNLNDR